MKVGLRNLSNIPTKSAEEDVSKPISFKRYISPADRKILHKV